MPRSRQIRGADARLVPHRARGDTVVPNSETSVSGDVDMLTTRAAIMSFLLVCSSCTGLEDYLGEDNEQIDVSEFHVPIRAIAIDGRTDDWSGAAAAYTDDTNDENGQANFVGTDLHQVYMAKDDRFLYIMITLADGNPNPLAQYTIETVPTPGQAGTEGDYLAVASFRNGSWGSHVHVRGHSHLNVSYDSTYIAAGDGVVEWKAEIKDLHFFSGRYLFAYVHNYTPIFFPVSDQAKTGVKIVLQ